MPWKETTVLDDRLQFIAIYLNQELSMADLCRAFDISRKTGYKFVQRYRLYGPEGLYDLHRATYTHPNAIPEQVEEQILDLRAAHPTWGPRKLRAVLQRDIADIAIPAASTIGAVLQRHGLTVPRKCRRNTSFPASASLTPITGTNEVWCADFKGHFPLKNGRRCHPLTITDAYSRTLLRCQALLHPDTKSVRPIWVAAFREYGLPKVIRTDNGPPFASNGLAGLSALAIWWIKLGIRPERIAPGHPEQNGRHERMHLTLKIEATRPPQVDINAQQRVFDHFRHEYNHVRPHEALNQQTPASVYSSSSRPYPLRLPEVEYPSGVVVRRVRTDGCIRWRGGMLFVSETLTGEPVGLDRLDDRHWALYFGQIPLSILDDHICSWLPPKSAAAKILSLLEENFP
jgi:transposase InsO family protein